MARATSTGICELCGAPRSKAAMGAHLRECAPGHDAARGSVERVVQLRVDSPGIPFYWLEVEARESATLRQLDSLLRHIWLECCGHMSAFHVDGVMYAPSADWKDFRVTERSLGTRLATLGLAQGKRFRYEYDFGTPTELALRVGSRRDGRIGRAPIRLLARNEPPVWECRVCKAVATSICSQCLDRSNPFLCRRHEGAHRCGEEMLLPVVNSPRMGMCGYTG